MALIKRDELLSALIVGIFAGGAVGTAFDDVLAWTIAGAVFGLLYGLRRIRALNIVLGVGIIGVIVLAVLLPSRHHDRRRLHLAEMRSHLRDLVSLEEEYFEEHHRYASDLAELDTTSLHLGPVTLVVQTADSLGWTAIARHRFVTNTCTISVDRNHMEDSTGYDLPSCTDGTFTNDYAAYRDSMDRVHAQNQRLDSIVPVAAAACAFDSLAPTPNPGRRPEVEDLGYPVKTVDQLTVRKLLLDRSYDALDSLLAAYNDSARRDFRLEYHMTDSYRAFDIPLNAIESFVDEWVRERPRSANARLVRATYYTAAGWDTRNPKRVVKATQPPHLGMGAYFRRAKTDVLAALELAPCNPYAFELLMRAADVMGDKRYSRALVDQALTMQPYSFILRARHMYNLRPRWRGSYSAMEMFAGESERFADVNPRLHALHGFIAWDRGDEIQRESDTTQALEKYTQALSAADFWQFRFDRGRLYHTLHREVEALADLDRALVQRPLRTEILIERSSAAWDLGKRPQPAAERRRLWTQAIRDANLAAAIDPTDAYLQEWVDYYRKEIPGYVQTAGPMRPESLRD